MKNIILTFIILTSSIVTSQNTNSSKKNEGLEINRIYQKIDSLNYSELDFNKMKKYYTENFELNSIISKKAAEGNNDAAEFLDLLNLTFDKAVDKIGETNVKALIYSYYSTLEIMEKFENLNLDFDKKIDSLRLQKEYFEKEIKEDNQTIDSLKNN